MRVVGVVILILAAAVQCYLEPEITENRLLTTIPFKTFFFLKRLSPYNSKLDRPLSMGAQKRIESEEKFSPFHSVLVIKKQRRSDEPIRRHVPITGPARTESAESFIKDFLVSHLQHMNSIERSNQFNTEKIYNDMYNRGSDQVHTSTKSNIHRGKEIIGDEIDAIIAHAAKEFTPNTEETENENASLGKTLRKTKKRVGKKIKRAGGVIGKKVKLNWLTILIFIIIGLISGFAGYSLRGRTSSEHYVPLDK
ncbi:hypothetical protein NEIG_00030 [Nematocida sp. ERTm5]|nr:hypothetical protein NEIRO02_0041 [Nematocida sp. AWRm79]KAI5182461.1 hypothetical protein NEIRO03_0145 [Nematocida sp. AWRm78]OAG30518.1 hypothetical protein NEIG_00030 [Nematocida sp. ERTm5]